MLWSSLSRPTMQSYAKSCLTTPPHDNWFTKLLRVVDHFNYKLQCCGGVEGKAEREEKETSLCVWSMRRCVCTYHQKYPTSKQQGKRKQRTGGLRRSTVVLRRHISQSATSNIQIVVIFLPTLGFLLNALGFPLNLLPNLRQFPSFFLCLATFSPPLIFVVCCYFLALSLRELLFFLLAH
jgi:hypothetical protein